MLVISSILIVSVVVSMNLNAPRECETNLLGVGLQYISTSTSIDSFGNGFVTGQFPNLSGNVPTLSAGDWSTIFLLLTFVSSTSRGVQVIFCSEATGGKTEVFVRSKNSTWSSWFKV